MHVTYYVPACDCDWGVNLLAVIKELKSSEKKEQTFESIKHLVASHWALGVSHCTVVVDSPLALSLLSVHKVKDSRLVWQWHTGPKTKLDTKASFREGRESLLLHDERSQRSLKQWVPVVNIHVTNPVVCFAVQSMLPAGYVTKKSNWAIGWSGCNITG